MPRNALSNRLKWILIGTGLCGLLLYFVLLPYLVKQLFPDRMFAFWTYLVFLWASGIPCYITLIYGWRIAHNIGLDRSFTRENATLLRKISTLAIFDSLYLLIGSLLFAVLGARHIMLLLLSLIIIFIGIAVAVAAAALSHLVLNAAELQEQSDLTI